MTLKKKTDLESWSNKKAMIRGRLDEFQQKLERDNEESWRQFILGLSQELGVTEYTIRKQLDE